MGGKHGKVEPTQLKLVVIYFVSKEVRRLGHQRQKRGPQGSEGTWSARQKRGQQGSEETWSTRQKRD